MRLNPSVGIYADPMFTSSWSTMLHGADMEHWDCVI